MAIQEIVCDLFQLGATCMNLSMETLIIEKLFVPSVVLIIALYAITGTFLRDSGLKIHSLLAVTFYIVCVYTGFYSFVAAFSMPFLFLFLILSFGSFIVLRFIPFHWIAKGGQMAVRYGESKYDTRLMLDRKSVLEDEIARMEKEIGTEEKMGDKMNQQKINAYRLLILQLEKEVQLLDKEIKRTKKIIP